MMVSIGSSLRRPAFPQRRWLCSTLCGHASHTCWTPHDLSSEDPAGSSVQESLLLLPPLTSSFCFPHIAQVHLLCARHCWQQGPQRQVCWDLLCQSQGEGFPGRKPNLLAIFSSSRVCGLLLAAWRQLHPARGQGILGLLVQSFLSILYPNFQF